MTTTWPKGLTGTDQFIKDATNCGLDIRPYAGRWFWYGPAVVVSGFGDFYTDVPTQHDNMGRDYIVYPVESDPEWYDAATHTSQEAVCASCGEDIMVPADEDPEDTLCVACAEEES